MSEQTELFKAMKDFRQEEHADNFENNMKLLRKSDVTFQERPTSCLFREAGKPRVDFYPHTGRWRIVGLKKTQTRGGGAKKFLEWYGKCGVQANWEQNSLKVFNSDLASLLECEKKQGVKPNLCPICFQEFDKSRPVKIHKDESGKIIYWEYSHCNEKLIMWNKA